MSLPVLVALAHGSRDPRSAATVAELIDVVRARRPELDARLAFLDFSAPRLDAVLAGVQHAVVVPLLLGRAYHAKVDVPGAVSGTIAVRPRLSVRIADVLGPDERLEWAALHRLAAVGVRPGDAGTGVVLAAACSSSAPANAVVTALARRWAARTAWSGVGAAFASAAHPTVPEAIAALRAGGAQRVALASWFLAPGLLPDKVARQARETDPDVLLADPLGPDPGVADLFVARYDAALAQPTVRSA